MRNLLDEMLTYTSSGGLEMLFSNQRKHKVSLPSTDVNGTPSNIAFLIQYLCQNLMKDERRELFILDDSVYALPA